MAPGDRELVAALRAGDEAAFGALVDRHGPALLRVATALVPSRAVAEEVVQETWIGVLGSLERFEGRSSLKTWIFRILTNTALTSGRKERRSVPFAALVAEDPDAPAVDPERFLPAAHDRWPGHWAVAPAAWPTPEAGLLSGELRQVLAAAIAALPPAQRTVIGLRDVEGWPADEVCEALELSAGNQRVLLHRARAGVRTAVEAYLGAVEPLVGSEEV